MGNELKCYSCPYCKHGPCDGPGHYPCDKSYDDHRKLFHLVYDFSNKVNNAFEYVKETVKYLNEDLRNKDIKVSWTSDIYQYLENMKETKAEIQDEYLKLDTNEIRKKYEKKFDELRKKHELEIQKINNDFQEKRKKLEREMENKRNAKNNLENKLSQIKIENPGKKERELNSFKDEKKLEFSEEEKKTMENYLDEIFKIYEYSEIIPENLINNLFS